MPCAEIGFRRFQKASMLRSTSEMVHAARARGATTTAELSIGQRASAYNTADDDDSSVEASANGRPPTTQLTMEQPTNAPVLPKYHLAKPMR